jgi:transcription antitermination factor NusG
MATYIRPGCSPNPIALEAQTIERPDWYAVRVRPRSEKVVARALREKGYEDFLPLYRKRSQWSDRTKDIDLPLFPGYVFCRADLLGKPPLISTPSVIGILSFCGAPAVISDPEIEAVRLIVNSGAHVEPWPFLREGQRVRIERGSLAGLEGIVLRTKSDWRVVLSVEALCRSVAVEIDRDQAAPVSSFTVDFLRDESSQ